MSIKENISDILKWNRYNAVIVLLGFFVALLTQSTLFLGGITLLSFGFYIYNNISTLHAMKPFGAYANWVTAFRLILLLIAMFFWDTLENHILISGLLVFVCLDGIDGWMARKYDHETIFGQYFDMELDSLYVLFASVIIYFKGIAGAWLLIPGALRYIFVLFTWMMGPSKNKEDRTSYGAAIAVSFFISLLISLTFQNIYQSVFLFISASLVIFSFGISFYKYRIS